VNSGSLPAGLQIVGNEVTSTPTAPAVVAGNAISFLATDSAKQTPVTAISSTTIFIVKLVQLVITSNALTTGTIGAAYSYQLTLIGDTGAIT